MSTQPYECRRCGLSACDLPDDIPPEFIFTDGLCMGCDEIVPGESDE